MPGIAAVLLFEREKWHGGMRRWQRVKTGTGRKIGISASFRLEKKHRNHLRSVNIQRTVT